MLVRGHPEEIRADRRSCSRPARQDRYLAAFAICIPAAAFASGYKPGPIEINNPWSRATPKEASTAIGYMAITNSGSTPDRLVGASVDTAGRVEFHSMVMDHGVSKMRDLPAIEIKPGETVELKPIKTPVSFFTTTLS